MHYTHINICQYLTLEDSYVGRIAWLHQYRKYFIWLLLYYYKSFYNVRGLLHVIKSNILISLSHNRTVVNVTALSAGRSIVEGCKLKVLVQGLQFNTVVNSVCRWSKNSPSTLFPRHSKHTRPVEYSKIYLKKLFKYLKLIILISATDYYPH